MTDNIKAWDRVRTKVDRRRVPKAIQPTEHKPRRSQKAWVKKSVTKFRSAREHDDVLANLREHPLYTRQDPNERYKQCKVCTCWMLRKFYKCGFCGGLTFTQD